MTNVLNTTDPMMALIAATHARTQIAMGELSELAGEQQNANELLNELRKLEGRLRELRSDEKIERRELEALVADVAKLRDKGVVLNIDVFIEQLTRGLHAVETAGDEDVRLRDEKGGLEQGGDYLWADANSEYHQDADAQLENIKNTFEGAKDTVRG